MRSHVAGIATLLRRRLQLHSGFIGYYVCRCNWLNLYTCNMSWFYVCNVIWSLCCFAPLLFSFFGVCVVSRHCYFHCECELQVHAYLFFCCWHSRPLPRVHRFSSALLRVLSKLWKCIFMKVFFRELSLGSKNNRLYFARDLDLYIQHSIKNLFIKAKHGTTNRCMIILIAPG